MLSAYPACFIKEDIGYSVIFPDLDHLATCGDSFEEAYSMAVDCLAGYLYDLDLEGKKYPKASELGSIDVKKLGKELDLEIDDYIPNMVAVDVAEYAKLHFEKAVKKTLTIPAWLNKLALEQDVNFSQVLQEALKKKLLTKKGK